MSTAATDHGAHDGGTNAAGDLADQRHEEGVADTLAAAGRTWKTYAEGLPQAGFTGPFAGRYAKKHDPFVYFRRVAAMPSKSAAASFVICSVVRVGFSRSGSSQRALST